MRDADLQRLEVVADPNSDAVPDGLLEASLTGTRLFATSTTVVDLEDEAVESMDLHEFTIWIGPAARALFARHRQE
jgi:hypothetical protein